MLSRSFAGIVVFGMALLVPIPTEACSTLVYDHHGPILPSPAVSFIYLQDGNSYWASAEGQAELRAYNAWGNVLSTKAFWSRLREYQIGTGYYASGNNAVINTPPPSSGYLQDYDIAQI